jgi:glyoxylase-like metal-dependent hydrolase (beta-lactamase superfamily II)
LKTLRFDDVTVDRCVESEGPSFYPEFIFPALEAEAFAREREDWLDDRLVDAASGRLLMSLHSYVIRTRHHTVLVDTCVGNHKHRPDTPPWHLRDGPFLDRLRDMGTAPEDVDFVMCTHLHVDHVGWNTRLENGRWIPTFPNARYLFHRTEYEHWETAQMPEGSGNTRRDAFEDSVLPVVSAGQALLVDGDHAIDDQIHLEPAPGHTPGHVFAHLRTPRGHAVFTGDCIHHPVQIAFPDLNSRYCVDPALAGATRRDIVERAADTDIIMLGAHFPAPVAGRVVTDAGRWKLRWLDAGRAC